MRLNLGCGRAQLPTTRDNPFTIHLIQLPDSAFTAEDWVNIDAAKIDGIDEVVNLFEYPWPWADNSADEIWCSHLIEHIPHLAMLAFTPERPYKETLANMARLDGWYAFFHEVHRVLKPGGIFHAITPHGQSVSGMTDPTHTRYILPGTFSYFKPNPDAPFDYGLPYEFEAVHEPFLRPGDSETIVRLAIIAQEKDEAKRKELETAFWAWALPRINVFNEIYIQLKAV